MHLPQLPPSVYVAGLAALATALVLVLTKRWHGRFSMDGVHGVQKAHANPTPRIGGVAIVAGVLAGYLVARPERKAILGTLLVAGLPAFAFGLAEDVTKKVSIMARLLATMASGVLGWWLTGTAITSLDVPGLDRLLQFTVFSVAFTAFAVGGVANAVNIVDGFNGLASGFVVIALAGVGLLALSAGDLNLALACWSIAAAVLGFWLINWPWGKLFLGDGGCYFGGFALAWACVLLIERNANITPFAALLVCIHPVTEVLFSIYRRRLHGSHPGHPDRLHLHSLLARRVVRPTLAYLWPDNPQFVKAMRNSATGLLQALMNVPAVLAAFLVETSAAKAAVLCVVFMLAYVTLYARLVRFKWCSPITFLLTPPVIASKAK